MGNLKVDGEYYRNVLIVVLILQLKPQQHVPYFITFASDGGTIGRKMITMTATPVLPIHDPVFGMEII